MPEDLLPLFRITHSTDKASERGVEPLLPEHLEPLAEPRNYGAGRGTPGEGTRFRLYDGDDNLYFEGTMWSDGSEDEDFAPLEWGRHDSGCAYMKCWEKGPNGAFGWHVL